MCSRGRGQQVQRPWGRDLLDGSRNIVKVSVAGVEGGGGEDGDLRWKEGLKPSLRPGRPFVLSSLTSILALACILEQGRRGLGLGLSSAHLLCAGDSAEHWTHIRSPYSGPFRGE